MTNVYLMKDGHTGLYKIGRSNDPSTRERTLLGQVPKLDLLCYWTGCSNEDEKVLHDLFSKQRQRGEWFNLCPAHVEVLYLYFNFTQRVDVTRTHPWFYAEVLNKSFTFHSPHGKRMLAELARRNKAEGRTRSVEVDEYDHENIVRII